MFSRFTQKAVQLSVKGVQKRVKILTYVHVCCYHQHTWETGVLKVWGGCNSSGALEVGGTNFAVDPSKIREQSVHADPMPTPAPKAIDAQRVTGVPIW